MRRKILLWIIERLYRWTYAPTTVDTLNKKLIRPVPGLVINGVQYWEFIQIADMPEQRRAMYMDVRRELAMSIDEKLLIEYIEKLKEANNKADASRIGSLLFMLEDTIKNVTTVESLYNLATMHFFDEREDLASYDLDYALRKKEAFKSFIDKGFFFSALLRTDTRSSGKSQQQDIMEYLKVEGVKLESYRRIRSGSNASGDSVSSGK